MTRDTFESLYRLLRTDVIRFGYAAGWFAKDRPPTWQQKAALDEINAAQGQPFYGGIKSGQGVGKTSLESLVAAWRAFRSFGAPTYVTAPTMRQVKDVFIKELRLSLERGDPVIAKLWDIQATRALLFGKKDWGVIGLSATRPENFQGYHHPNMSFIADEASGVAREIIETIFGTLTNDDRFFLACGNPNTRDCAFFDFFGAMRDTFQMLLTFNAEESPIVNQENVRRLAEIYGRNSDIYRVRVLGEFPLQDPKCIMSSDDLEACARNDLVECVAGPQVRDLMPAQMRLRQFGLDFARYGGDRNVIVRRSGLAVVEMESFSRAEPADTVARAFAMQARAGWAEDDTYYVADADGIGQGVLKTFYDARKQIHEFHSAGTAYKSDTYYDTMTEAMFELAQLVKLRAVCIPNDPELIRELSTRQYAAADGVRGRGRLKIESKEMYTKRTKEVSPDKGDACAMAFYPFAFGRAVVAAREARGRTATNRRA